MGIEISSCPEGGEEEMGTGTAMILAGGESRRMGFDKQELKIAGKLATIYIADRLTAEFNEIIIVTNKPDLYNKSGYSILKDKVQNAGPLGGLYTGLSDAGNEIVYVTACDMPMINLDYIRYMKKAAAEHPAPDAVVTKYHETMTEPFNAFYSRKCVSHIEKLLEEQKVSISFLLKEMKTHYIDESVARRFSPDWRMFTNLNTRHDLNGLTELDVI